MSIPSNVATMLRKHVTLEVEGIDRLYLNGYVPGLQAEGGVVYFILATSALGAGSETCPPCGRSAFPPTDVCWTSND